MIVEKLKNLGKIFSDFGTFNSSLREAYNSFNKQTNVETLNEVFVQHQAGLCKSELKEYITSVTRKSSCPPFNIAIPLLFTARTTLQGLVFASDSFLRKAYELEPISYQIAQEELLLYGKQSNKRLEQKDFDIHLSDSVRRTKKPLDFIKGVVIPFLIQVHSLFREELTYFDFHYDRVLVGIENQLVEGKEAAVRMANALLDIEEDKDLFAFIEVNSNGTLKDKSAYRKFPESLASPKELAILIYYLHRKKIITNDIDTHVSRYVSLLTGVSHNTIRTALGQVSHPDITSSVLVDGEGMGSRHAENVKKYLREIIQLIDIDISNQK